MAVDDSMCTSHERNRVALYCQTCEVLICTKCVSHSPYNVGQHKDHVYLDIGEAYDIFKDELDKLLSGIHHELQEKKNEKQRLQSNLQKLQLCLLRKRTELEKAIKSLKDRLHSKEKQFISGVEEMIVPTIHKVEAQHKSVEYDLVSGDGLLGTATAIQSMDKSRAVAFLKNLSGVKKDYLSIHSRNVPKDSDPSDIIQSVINVNLNLHREKYLLDRAFVLADKAPSMPQPIYSWCVIGNKSANLVWKFTTTDTVNKFHVYYKKFCIEDLKYICVHTDFVTTNMNAVDLGVHNLIKWDEKNRASICSTKRSDIINVKKHENNEVDDIINVKKHENNDVDEISNKQDISHDSITKDVDRNIKPSLTQSILKLIRWRCTSKNDKVDACNELSSPCEDQDKPNNIDIPASDAVKPQRIRKLSYTISKADDDCDESNIKTSVEESSESEKAVLEPSTPTQRQYIDPTDFLNETQKYKNHVEKQAKVWPSYHQSRIGLSSSFNSGRSLAITPGIQPRKNMCPNSSRTSQVTKSYTRPYRAHSVETPSRKTSTSLVSPRSTTPLRYPESQSRRISYPTKDSTVFIKPTSNRVSRRDHSSNKKSLQKSNADGSYGEDENMKDIYNEKSHLKSSAQIKSKDSNTRSRPALEIKGSFLMYGRSGNDEKSTDSSDEKNKNINIGGERKSNSSDQDKKGHFYSISALETSSKKSTSSDSLAKTSEKEISNEESVATSNGIKLNREYINLNSADQNYINRFKRFKVSKFVAGRVHATLRDLDEDSDYITLVSAVNQNGCSPACVFHFKTGALSEDGTKSSKCGHMIRHDQRQKKSLLDRMSNVLSYFISFVCLVSLLFIVFYLFSQNIQNAFCRSLSKENGAVSKLCPELGIQNLCGDYSFENQKCEGEHAQHVFQFSSSFVYDVIIYFRDLF